MALMKAWREGLGFDPLDFLFQDQFSVFERFNFLVVSSRMDPLTGDFSFESLVAAFEFDQVSLYRHAAPPNDDR